MDTYRYTDAYLKNNLEVNDISIDDMESETLSKRGILKQGGQRKGTMVSKTYDYFEEYEDENAPEHKFENEMAGILRHIQMKQDRARQKTLIQAGADPTESRKNFKSPIELAKEQQKVILEYEQNVAAYQGLAQRHQNSQEMSNSET